MPALRTPPARACACGVTAGWRPLPWVAPRGPTCCAQPREQGDRERVDYLAPFSPAPLSQELQQQQQQPGSDASPGSDPWAETLAVNHTLSSLYLRKVKVAPFKQLDHEARRRSRDLADITAAGAKAGVSGEALAANLEALQALVPGLIVNLDRMKASDWAAVLRDVDRVVGLIVAIKTAYPRVDVGELLKRRPKLLLRSQEALAADAAEVKAMLARCGDVDAIIQAVPDLTDPACVVQSLGQLKKWFPNVDPFVSLQTNPTCLLNVGEADLDADPLYGEITTAG